MLQIPYNDSAHELRLDFPAEWDPANVSAVTVAVKDEDGESLLSAQSATLYTATALNGAASAYAVEITLATGAGDVAPGDRLVIDGVSGTESVRVKGYNSSTKVVTLTTNLKYDHEDGANVYGTWATYDLDTSTVANYPAGLIVTLIWTPTGSGHITRQLAQIAVAVVDATGLEADFEILYPRAYKAFTRPTNNFAAIVRNAELRLKQKLLEGNPGFDYDRVVDQEAVKPLLMAQMAVLWVLNGDENKEDERRALEADYLALLEGFKQNPKWTDDDQDDKKDDEEVSDHETEFDIGW